jgi:hypothetical protein
MFEGGANGRLSLGDYALINRTGINPTRPIRKLQRGETSGGIRETS